ncbi:hypothetical protein BJ322DRAFT_1102935 [Thelephora terrestris]|uniref:Uncharacterized protein n=1 Tax=Thelephora terrestris TaxID=56493 RepID=A0A9P6HRB0_9AGAM|nr:hypothetical protein BJ322DRAFT_1102935 [Thelephora terrestris]
MAGPNLEVFKFGLYVFFPVLMLLKYGDSDWYQKNVIPYRNKVFPPEEKTVRILPADHSKLKEELDRIKAEKLQRKLERERKQAATDSTD